MGMSILPLGNQRKALGEKIIKAGAGKGARASAVGRAAGER